MDVHQYYQQMQSNGIIMAYKGAASGDLLNSIIAIAQTKLNEVEQKSVIRRRVFTILVEILQNIQNHFDYISAEEIREDDAIMFIMAKTEDGYYKLISGNYVSTNDVPSLKKRIDDVNALSADDLKAMYRDRLDNGQISPKGGAGLGIIEIARKSSNKLDYEFRVINDKFSFFSLTVKVAAS